MFQRSMFKNNGRDSASLRKSRHEHSLSLRKQTREENMAKRRNMNFEFEVDLEHGSEAFQNCMSLEEIIAGVKSSDVAVQIQAISQVRNLISFDQNPPIDELINSDLLPVLICCLQTTNDTLQYEAVWVLNNIAGGTSAHTRSVVLAGAIPHFVNLLSSPNVKICDQAICALGNIVGESSKFRNCCIDFGIVQSLIKFIHLDVPIDLLRNVAWALTNVCRNSTYPPPKQTVDQTLSALFKLIQREDSDVVKDAAWALYYISKIEGEYFENIIEIGFIPYLVRLLTCEDVQILTAVVGTLGNISSGENEQTQVILDCGVLKNLFPLLMHTKTKIVKNAVWILVNVTAGDYHQRQAFVDSGLIPTVINLLERGDFIVQKEASCLVSNMAGLGKPGQIFPLLSKGVLKPLCDLLGVGDIEVIQLSLKSLFHILKKFPGDAEQITRAVEEFGGMDKLEKLQDHENRVIYRYTLSILQEFYDADDAVFVNDSAFEFEYSQKEHEPINQFQF